MTAAGDPRVLRSSWGPPTETAELLRAAAFYGHTTLLRLLLLLSPTTAFLRAPELMPDVFEEAYTVYDSEGDTGNQFKMGWTAMHTAAAGGSAACAGVLLQAEPRLAAIDTLGGWRPAHIAAWHGRTEVLRLLVGAAPETAAATEFDGYAPVHYAALGGWEGCARLLLAAAPASANARTGLGEDPLHLVSLCQRPRDPSGSNHAAVVQLLLELHPEGAAAPDGTGRLPLACCAGSSSGTADVLGLLLQAYPEAVRVRDDGGCLPSHLAAAISNLAALGALFVAAPQTFVDASLEEGLTPMHYAVRNGSFQAVSHLLHLLPISAAVVDSAGRLPLTLALERIELLTDHMPAALMPLRTAAFMVQWQIVRRLLPAMPAATALSALAWAHEDAKAFFPQAVACHLPLSPAEWLLVPEPCPELGSALPAALQHGQSQAGQLVRRLPPADKARLRTAALCMARAQRRTQVCLPPALVERILALSFAALP